ncbi:MFS transporter [Amycolatopsis saalfeldensis]|uniref:Predicted arabinose efflux permease, MFS family n=1 Tax=Amycolatopsis saalfeldensis TaxID=394193 RepID=A0A1H8YKA8_9PSEU|nr:MFS transporter [Amycolatopsis saalfeldensis]SEP52523.1 Predicted arabinose efflux permease, MFS family [Amycolatopsis saalfeldensis]
MPESVLAPAVTGRRSFTAAAATLAALYSGNNLPSALYALLRGTFGFSALVQTLLYATAVAVIVPALLVSGPLSDLVGRRGPMLFALGAFLAGDVVFALAPGTGWLFVARIAQGLGMGAGAAAAQAMLGDSAGEGPRGQRRAAMTATACVTFGLALGPLAGGLLAQYGPAPRHLSFAVHAAAVLAVACLVWRTPRPAPVQVRGWRPPRLGVPAAIRRTFVIVAASSFLAWAVLGMFSAVVPSLVGTLLGSANLAVAAAALALMIATSGFVQFGARRLPPTAAQASGLVVLAAGLAVLVLANGAHLPWLVVPAMLGTGAGHGLVFTGALAELGAVTPPEERGSVIGTYYVVSYVGLGGPVIGVGLLAIAHGLPSATVLVAAVIGACCLVLAPLVFLEIRRRNRPQ